MVGLWDAATGTGLKTLQAPSLGTAVALSPDGNRIATVAGPSRDLRKTVRITDVATGTELHTLNAPDVIHIDFSPAGRRLATFAFGAGGLMVVEVWDTATGQELLTFKCGANDRSASAPTATSSTLWICPTPPRTD